jgi:hypothetical protein
MFADPPSVVGIGGGQMVEGELGAAAVVLADCIDVSRPSPGNSRGVCELREEAALIEAVLPLAGPDVVTDPLTAALVVVDPLVVAEDDDVAEIVDVDGSDDVVTPRGSDPIAEFPLVVWPSAAVCAWAAVTPTRMIAVSMVRCIAFSCIEKRSRRLRRSLAMQDNA